MKRTFFAITLAALVIGLVTRPVAGQEAKADDQTTVRGSVTVGAQAVGETERSSKFTEYRDVPRGSFLQALTLDLTKGRGYFRLAARNVQQADQSLLAGMGRHGAFRMSLGYSGTPHRFSFFGATPYVERTPGVFTLNDVIRSAAEALVPTGTSTNIAAARTLVSSFLASAAPIDLGLRRRKGGLDLTVTPSVPVKVRVEASRETRIGNRPFGAPLGFSNAIEVAEPIQHATTALSADVEVRKGWGAVRAGVAASLFDNEVQTLTWDNPYRITDSTYPSAYVAGNGTSRGRMSLWPSNNAVRFFAGGSVKPARGTRVSATLSYGIFDQNERLLPFTINTALPASDPNAAGALSAPRETAQAKAGVTSFDLTVSSRLTGTVSLAAGVRYYDFANRLTALDIPTGYARVDQVWEDVPVAAEPYSFSRLRLFGDVTVRVLDTTSLKIGYSQYNVRRHEGAAPAGADRSDEGTFKVSLDSRPLDWLSLRASYLSAERDWSLESSFVAYIPGFNFKRYFEAGRKRRGLNAEVGLSPTDRLDVQMTYGFGHDDYPGTTYGLTRDDFDMFGADVSYAITKDQSLFAFYVHERYDSGQAARQSSGDAFSTSPLDDWTANLKDLVNTLGAGQTLRFRGGRLEFDLTASYSRAAGSSSLFSPPGGTPDAAVNFDKPLDTTAWWVIQSSLKWRLTKSLSAVFSYWYEEYDLDDIVRNDVAVNYASAGAIFLGALEPGYKYHVGTVRLIYGW